jgi:hypothetical protein
MITGAVFFSYFGLWIFGFLNGIDKPELDEGVTVQNNTVSRILQRLAQRLLPLAQLRPPAVSCSRSLRFRAARASNSDSRIDLTVALISRKSLNPGSE